MKFIDIRRRRTLSALHRKCSRMITDALGISRIPYVDLYISGWYLAGILLTCSIRMLRNGISMLSVYSFCLSIILVLLLALLGLINGRLKHKFGLKRRKK